MAFLMVGNGLQGSVLGVRAELEGFGFAVTGAVMAAYFLGFLFGTAIAVRFVAAVGHIRGFAALASSAAILHAVWVNPAIWTLLRLVFGLGLAAIYASSEGLSDGRIAVFTAAAPLGCVVFQWPIGWLSDRVSRRAVIGVTAVAAALAAAGALLTEPGSGPSLVLMFLFGGFTFPLHSLAVAITADRVAPAQITSATATLVRLTGVGAAIFPAVAGALMGAAGPAAFYLVLVGVHAVIAVYVLYRVVTHPTIPVDEQSDYVAVPARGTAVTANLHPDAVEAAPLPPAAPDPDAPAGPIGAAPQPGTPQTR